MRNSSWHKIHSAHKPVHQRLLGRNKVKEKKENVTTIINVAVLSLGMGTYSIVWMEDIGSR